MRSIFPSMPPKLFQLVEGLTFLHNDAKILQASLAPEMIVITKNGQWKIAGLFFSSTPVVIDGQVNKFFFGSFIFHLGLTLAKRLIVFRVMIRGCGIF